MATAHPKILSVEELGRVREGLRADGLSVVQCHGCFDIVHPGHIRYLRFAKSLGDKLVISVSSDEVVGKGFDRPYIPEHLRLENLAALEFVDYVCLSGDDWGGPVLETLRPDVYVKGKEYETNRDPRFLREKEIVERYGGRVVFSSGDVVFSSTEIIRRYRERFGLDTDKLLSFCDRNHVTRAGLLERIAAFRDKRVVVVGDAILDHYVHCEQTNVASEGPILSVTPVVEDWFVGGAGLVARQMAALGAKPVFVTAAAPGADLDRVREGLAKGGVELKVVEAPSRQVYVKTRYLVSDQKLFKVNRGHYAPLDSQQRESLEKLLRDTVTGSHGLVVLDFGYGLFGDALCAFISSLSQETRVPYYADVSTNGRANLLKFKAPRLVTPTEQELRFAMADAEAGLAPLAAKYYAESGAENLVVTLGKRGAIHFDRRGGEAGKAQRLHSEYMPALSPTALDTVGAGDMLLTGAVLMDLAGGSPAEGLYFGSVQSSLKIMNIGNDIVPLRDIVDHLEIRTELTP